MLSTRCAISRTHGDVNISLEGLHNLDLCFVFKVVLTGGWIFIMLHLIFLSLFVSFWFVIPLKNFSLMETSPIPVNDCNILPIIGTKGH